MRAKRQRGSRQTLQPTAVAAVGRYRLATTVLPSFELFQQQFRSAFGRELTREERRFYRLVNIVLEEQAIHASAKPALAFPLSHDGTEKARKSA